MRLNPRVEKLACPCEPPANNDVFFSMPAYFWNFSRKAT
jgi:hypothetical protein